MHASLSARVASGYVYVCSYHYYLSTPLDKSTMRPRLMHTIKSTTKQTTIQTNYSVKVRGETDAQKLENQSHTKDQRLADRLERAAIAAGNGEFLLESPTARGKQLHGLWLPVPS